VGFGRRAIRLALCCAGVALITWTAYAIPVNSLTVGLAYLLLVLVIATTWGFPEALVASLGATLALNFFFLEPRFTLTIADPQNWVALFSFLVTALIASRLSTKAKERELDAIEANGTNVDHGPGLDRQNDLSDARQLQCQHNAAVFHPKGTTYPYRRA